MKVVCDVDGVIADPCKYVEKHLLGGKSPDWEKYYDKTLEFPCIESMVEVIKSLYDSGHGIYFVTARPELNRAPTYIWLKSKMGFTPCNLFMSNGEPSSLRSNREFKLEIINKIVPDLVIEDEPEAVDLFRSRGYIVLQVHGFRICDRDLVPDLGGKDES